MFLSKFKDVDSGLWNGFHSVRYRTGGGLIVAEGVLPETDTHHRTRMDVLFLIWTGPSLWVWCQRGKVPHWRVCAGIHVGDTRQHARY